MVSWVWVRLYKYSQWREWWYSGRPAVQTNIVEHVNAKGRENHCFTINDLAMEFTEISLPTLFQIVTKM